VRSLSSRICVMRENSDNWTDGCHDSVKTAVGEPGSSRLFFSVSQADSEIERSSI
jgi:hypothetical protein